MAFGEQSVHFITRHMGPTPLGSVLSRWARDFYSPRWIEDGRREVIIEHADRGLRMRVDRTHHIGGALYWRGFHSRWLLRCLDRILRPDMTLFDVGANQGEVTLYAARHLPRGKVVAFEPTDDNYQRLISNVQLNNLSNVSTHKYGLGDERGQMQMYAADERSRHHKNGWNEGLASMFAANEQCALLGMAEVYRLDDLFPTLDTERLDVLKIDVEGAERAVLHGAQDTIARFRPWIIMEINANTCRTAGYSTSELCELLRGLGYDGAVIDRSGRGAAPRTADFPELCDTLWTPLAR